MPPLLLLHGALGAADQLLPLAAQLRHTGREIHTLNFSGHGGSPFPTRGFSIPLFAADIHTYLQQQHLTTVDIFGYSMGGYVAMYLARQQPHLVHRLVTLATKYHWDPATASKEVKHLHPPTILEKVPAFAQTLQQRHAPQPWETLLHHTACMMTDLGNNPALLQNDYPAITHPCLLIVGDKDKMVSLEETISTFRQIPRAQLTVLPATPHPIEQVDTEQLAAHIHRFLG